MTRKQAAKFFVVSTLVNAAGQILIFGPVDWPKIVAFSVIGAAAAVALGFGVAWILRP